MIIKSFFEFRKSTLKDSKFSSSQLKKACHNNDALATKNELLALISYYNGNINNKNLFAITTIFPNSPTLDDEIKKLDAYLYHPKDSSWEGEKLWQVIQELLKQKANPPKSPKNNPWDELNF